MSTIGKQMVCFSRHVNGIFVISSCYVLFCMLNLHFVIIFSTIIFMNIFLWVADFCINSLILVVTNKVNWFNEMADNKMTCNIDWWLLSGLHATYDETLIAMVVYWFFMYTWDCRVSYWFVKVPSISTYYDILV